MKRVGALLVINRAPIPTDDRITGEFPRNHPCAEIPVPVASGRGRSGDGATVANALVEAGYHVTVRVRDPYRSYIARVRKDGRDVLHRAVVRGSRDARDALLAHLVRYLDRRCSV